MAEVEINYTKVADTDPTIALRSKWSCLSQRIRSRLGEGEKASGRVIFAGGQDFEPSTIPK